MTIKQYSTCVTEAQNYTDRDAYISDLALSSMWGDGPEDDIPQDRLAQLGSIYDAVHRSVKDIASAAGISAREMAIRFCIPQRTMENWCMGVNKCPLYTRLMLQESIGIYYPNVAPT